MWRGFSFPAARRAVTLFFCLPAAVLLLAGCADRAPLSRPASALPSGAFLLVADGQPRAAVVLPDEPASRETEAAEELVSHLELMTGAQLPVTSGPVPVGLLPVYLGAAADQSLDEASRAAGDNPSTFTLRVRSDRVDIRGLSDEGTLFGVYELLEQLGFRWFIPGELGRVIPPGTTAALALQQETQAPSMEYRRLQSIQGTAWTRRVRLGGLPRSTGSHNFFRGEPRGTEGRQACVSGDYAPGLLEGVLQRIRRAHEPTDEKIYIGMGPQDGGAYHYCRCDGCRALDQGVYDPFWDAESMTDRYIWFFNRVLEELADEYPNLHLVWYVYQRHMMPPITRPNPRIVGVFAPINLDRLRGMDNPMSPDRHVLRWLIDEWEKTNPNELYYRGYYNNLACVQLPKTQLDRVRHEIPAIHERGINVMRVECIRQSWASDPLTLYVASRLMWDVNTDVDALLEDFYRKFYGPAAATMRRYHEKLEAAFRDTPYFTGSSYVYFPTFLDHPRRDQLRALLDRALAQSRRRGVDPVYAARLAALRQGYERLDLFLDMIAARNRFDFVTAHEKMLAFDELTDALADEILEGSGRFASRLVSVDESKDRSRNSYFNRFFRMPIVAGYERAVSRGEVIATLPEEWRFLLDPSEIGELGGWQRPGPLGGNWQPMKTATRSWSDQGLHYYKGVAWYRASVDIPAAAAGRPLYLWFGGVDAIAHVWINGHFVGTSREPEEGLPGAPGSFRPFDMPATGVARPGEENWVVVKIENRTLAELGTGGILAPVMFWAPRDAAWRPGN